jgi:hypothetical protein
MLPSKKFLTMLLITCSLLVASAVAAPPSDDHSALNSGISIRTVLQPDLTLKSTFSQSLARTPGTAVADKKGFCRCSCGFECSTDQQCGPGGRCDAFISCCDRGGHNEWFLQMSSRTGETPAGVKCK